MSVIMIKKALCYCAANIFYETIRQVQLLRRKVTKALLLQINRSQLSLLLSKLYGYYKTHLTRRDAITVAFGIYRCFPKASWLLHPF